MKKIICLSILVSFLSCKKTENRPVEDNVPSALDEVELKEAIKKVDSIEVLSKEMDEVQEPEIPERSSYRFAKIWQDGVENEPERGTASLFFSNEKQNLILNLAGNVINLKCVEKFNKNPDDYASRPPLWDRCISVGYACVACVYDTCCRDSHLPHSTQIKKACTYSGHTGICADS